MLLTILSMGSAVSIHIAVLLLVLVGLYIASVSVNDLSKIVVRVIRIMGTESYKRTKNLGKKLSTVVLC